MRTRRIAILIDGGYFIKRLPKLVEPRFHSTPEQVADSASDPCKRYVRRVMSSHANPEPPSTRELSVSTDTIERLRISRRTLPADSLPAHLNAILNEQLERPAVAGTEVSP